MTFRLAALSLISLALTGHGATVAAPVSDWKANCPSVMSLKDYQDRGGKLTPLYQTAPRYPQSKISSGEPGLVKIDYAISVDGNVVGVQVTQASDPEFETPAVAAVSKWRYSKPSLAGKPLCLTAAAEVSFRVE